MAQQLPMKIGVPRQYSQKDDAVCAHIDDLGDAGIGIVVSDDDEHARLEDHAGAGMPKVSVGETGCIHTVEVDPQIPGRRGCFGHVHSLWPTGVGSRSSEARLQAIEGSILEVGQKDVEVGTGLRGEEHKAGATKLPCRRFLDHRVPTEIVR